MKRRRAWVGKHWNGYNFKCKHKNKRKELWRQMCACIFTGHLSHVCLSNNLYMHKLNGMKTGQKFCPQRKVNLRYLIQKLLKSTQAQWLYAFFSTKEKRPHQILGEISRDTEGLHFTSSIQKTLESIFLQPLLKSKPQPNDDQTN